MISNKPDAGGLIIAEELHIATRCINHTASSTREAFDAELMITIDAYAPTLVILAGFMRMLTPAFVIHYAGRLVNIHPSLLPKFTGLNTRQLAIDASCTVAGMTMHMVTSVIDMGGPILAQIGSANIAGQYRKDLNCSCTNTRAVNLPTSNCRVFDDRLAIL